MNELSRLAALRRYDLLDTPKEAAFDHITRVVARVLGVPIALVSLVDADRQWFKASIGLDVSETPRSGAFCAHAIEQSEPFMIPDAAEDPRFATNPLVTGPPHIRSYAGAPLITPDGFRIGTLCAIDRRPRVHSEGDLATLEDLARVVVEILETRLSERQQRVLAKISTMSSDAAYVYDLKTRETIWESDRSSAVFGFDLRSPPAGVLDLVHPDDRAAVAALSQPPAGTTLAEPLVYRIRSGDSYRWLLSRRSVLDFDEHGKVRSIVGVVSDVTELKRAEERVRTSEHEVAHRVRVLEGILDAAAEAILFVDAGGQVRLTNRFARELLGGITTGVVPPPPDHVRRVGIYSEDGARLLAPDELPMARALRGERVDSMPLMIRNERFPAGVRLLASTRTVRGPEGELGGAVLS
ncbi:MAG TPA: GAF domain-containing protein, partial [Kofleriaceae bacterium]